MPTSKKWIFVWNIKDNEHLKVTQKTLEDLPAIDYMIAQLEKGTHVHWQGFIIFHSPNKFEQVKKKLEGAHIEKAWGTALENKTYCTKERTRDARNIRIERGVMPVGQGARGDIREMMKDVLELDNGEMMDKWDHRWYQYSRALKEYRLDMLPKREWVTSIEVYWGTTGKGKTRRAWYNAKNSGGQVGVIITPQSERDKFWGDGCVGAQHIIMDDMAAGQISHALFLRLLDRYPMVVEVKGTSMQWAPRTIYITSNTHPRHWYPNRKWRGSPLERRLMEFGMIEMHATEWLPPTEEDLGGMAVMEITPDEQLPEVFQPIRTLEVAEPLPIIISEMPVGLSKMPISASQESWP